jgi:threonine aldolase
MRQAGVLAAAGLIALEEHPALLLRDHENARWLAGELAKIPGIAIDPKRVETNILIFDISGSGLSTNEFSTRLKSHGVLFNGINAREMRIVTHYDVDRAGCERALDAIQQVAAGATSAAHAD